MNYDLQSLKYLAYFASLQNEHHNEHNEHSSLKFQCGALFIEVVLFIKFILTQNVLSSSVGLQPKTMNYNRLFMQCLI